jgi:hypothetical protein
MKTAGEIIDPATGLKLTTAIGPVERIKWLEQVAGDARLGDADAAFAIFIQREIDRRVGFAYRGVKWFADRIGIAERTTKLRLASLAEHGHIIIQRRGPTPAAIHLVLKDVQESCTSTDLKDVQESCTSTDLKDVQESCLSDSQKRCNISVNEVQDSGKKKCKTHFSNDVKSYSCEPITQGVTQRITQGSAVASARASSARAAPSQVRERTDSGYTTASDGSSLTRLSARSLPPEERDRSADHPSLAGDESREPPQACETEAPKPKRRRIDYKALLAKLDLETSGH